MPPLGRRLESWSDTLEAWSDTSPETTPREKRVEVKQGEFCFMFVKQIPEYITKQVEKFQDIPGNRKREREEAFREELETNNVTNFFVKPFLG